MTEQEMSGPLYPNQPLEEVATEIRFRGRLRVEQIRADFQEAIRDKYTNLYVPKALPTIPPAMQNYRFEAPEESCGVQLSVNSIGFYSRQYPGFSAFSSEIDRLIQSALELIGEIDVTRVGWRYINAIPFPRDKGRLPFDKVFQHQPWLASALEGDWRTFAFTSRMAFNDVEANLRLEAGTEDKLAQLETLVFDIDAFSTFDPPLEGATHDTCMDLMRRMHDSAREIFEISINDEFRSFLLGDP